MSVVIVGGNECMERRYKDICKSYQCRAKVFTRMRDGQKFIKKWSKMKVVRKSL